jgi:AraC-like DNA-binding protein
MTFVFDGRAPESPLIDSIWRTQSAGSGDSFISTAATQMSMVITKEAGNRWLTVRGPETKATNSGIPKDAEIFGINFKLGTFLTRMPGHTLVDGEINLPEAGSNSFWLNGSAWEFPNYDNVDVFVARLIREGLMAQDEIVTGILQNQPAYASIRTVRRRFLHATGLTYKVIQQIERAQQALTLLQGGTPILDAALTLGYFDQAHMTNSLKRFVGQTPAQILRVGDTT